MKKKKFQKNGLFAQHYLCLEGRKKRLFRAHCLLWPKSFGAKTDKTGNAIKIVVSGESAQNQKWHLCWKRFVWDGWKSGFHYLWFLKLCSAESMTLWCFQQSTTIAQKKGVSWKSRKFLKNCGVVLSMARRCFLFRCFVTYLVCGGWLCGVCFFCILRF